MSAAIQYPLPEFEEQQPTQPNLRLVPKPQKNREQTRNRQLQKLDDFGKHKELAKQLLNAAHQLVMDSCTTKSSTCEPATLAEPTNNTDSDVDSNWFDETALTQAIAFEFSRLIRKDDDWWLYRGFSFERRNGLLSLTLFLGF